MRTLTFNRIIGVGAMGTVYHADLHLPRGAIRTCAVKMMKPSNPDQEQFRARMRDEARLLGMLQDEQILGAHELLKVQGQDCVVMDYVDGVDLAQLIPTQRMPPKALAELGADLAATIHRAHAAIHPATGEPLRVIHRDVKPANVMLTRRGLVRLLDFGVARAAFSNRESQTQGLVLGTLNYFPPEILAGTEPTPAVDIYGLGLTLWECATGRDWGTPVVHRHRFERRVDQRLNELGPDYDAVAGVLRKLLQWRPEDRPRANAVEKLLRAAASAGSGMGLRAWARKTVPPILARRESEAPSDELVGKTLPVEPMPEPPLQLQRLELPQGGRAARPAETQTFNDLAPPAAVLRGAPRLDAIPPIGATPPPIDTTTAIGDGTADADDLALTQPKPIPPAALATEILVKPSGAPTTIRNRGEVDPGTSEPESAPAPPAPAPAPPVVPPPQADTLLLKSPALQLAARASAVPPPARVAASAPTLIPNAQGAPGVWGSVLSTLAMLLGAAVVGGILGAGLLLSVMLIGWVVAG